MEFGNIEIRHATLTEWGRIIEWQRREQWDLGLGDERCYFSADPLGFYMGYQGEKAVSAMSVVKFGQIYSHVGHFLVPKEMRKKGVGLETWEHVIRRAETTAVSGLDSVVEQRDNYANWGYVEAYKVFRLRGQLGSRITKGGNANFSRVSDINISKVVEFDEKAVGYNREAFLKQWFSGLGRQGWIYDEGTTTAAIVGVRQSTDGFRLGPIYATATDIFFVVLDYIVSLFPKRTVFTIDIPEFCHEEIRTLKSSGFYEMFYTCRMYRGGPPMENRRLVKSIASLDIG